MRLVKKITSFSNQFLLWFLIIFTLISFFACKKNNSFEIVSFNALTNSEFNQQSNPVSLEANLEDATLQGIRIPTEKQCKGSKLKFDFTVKVQKLM